MVVAQLVEWMLMTPEFRDLNPVMGRFYLLSAVLKRQKERKRPDMA